VICRKVVEQHSREARGLTTGFLLVARQGAK
jgi:hypothetical protein